jgi:hypothetical protein
VVEKVVVVAEVKPLSSRVFHQKLLVAKLAGAVNKVVAAEGRIVLRS